MKALIKVGYRCNNRCLFCHTAEDRQSTSSAAAVEAKVERAAELGHDMVVFSGGEPTMRPELVRWAQLASSLGMGVGLVTNGRMLSYPELVDRLLGLGLGYVHLSLHAGEATLHDAMVGGKAFAQSFAAVQLLAARGLDLVVNAVVCGANLTRLRSLVDLLLPLTGVRLKLSMVEAKGAARTDFDAMVPPVRAVAERVHDAILYGLSAPGGLAFEHEGIPLCLLPELAHLAYDLRRHGFATMSEVNELDFFPVDERNKVHPAACAQCGLRGLCPGLYGEYHARRGAAELSPVAVARPNSVSYAYRRSMDWPAGAPCPLRQRGHTPFDPGRDLLLRRRGSLHLFRTETRTFAHDELEAIKRQGGRLAAACAGGLRPLRPADVCRHCPVAPGCTGCYEMDEERAVTALASPYGLLEDLPPAPSVAAEGLESAGEQESISCRSR